MKRLIPLLLILSVLLSACGLLMIDDRLDSHGTDRDEAPVPETTTSEKSSIDGRTGASDSGLSVDAPVVEEVHTDYLTDEESEAVSDVTIASAPLMEGNYQSAILKAGEIDDNADWDNYLTYRKDSLDSFAEYVHDVDVSGRQIITVTDGVLPVLGANVSVYAGDKLVSFSRTYANGQTLFFPNANADSKGQTDFRVEIEKGGIHQAFGMNLRQGGPSWQFEIDAEVVREKVKLDVLFLLDATGSMADEIAQLQNNILSISQQIDDMGNVDVRYGLVHYRDREDAYVTEVHEFTPDVEKFQQDLNAVVADGGGDTPESLNAGLHDALHKVEWRGGDTIKLVFLVADAPPHLDYSDDYDYAQEMLFAAEQGIKIHPIASSGLDLVGEYIFRQIGQTTMGRFIFLTYEGGNSGEAGDSRTDLEAGSEDYTVDFLDGLVVRLVNEEINAFTGQD